MLSFILLALVRLREMDTLPEDENEINRLLSLCFREINEVLAETNEHFDHLPMHETRIQPHQLHDEDTGCEDKRPDFQWQFRDAQETDWMLRQKSYTIECKRLGKRTSGHNLNRDYVINGVRRFLLREWSYGEFCRSGVLIGYVQNLALERITEEIDKALQSYKLPVFGVVSPSFDRRNLFRVDQLLDRTEYQPYQFSIKHLWLDVRMP